ncbi:Glycosyltransferase, catalytic subunit of cellulose synthase and poly-beta-1,6-N-acetylglucosamine synthase [Halobiforma haloterrestris]|uniref:Glycosyltransferase, catalytic subunit of cellulose synthase and poly-beta-1,6-N-acetylglucosamine synthase n=1 Tax=Natronobacterium haloterrestre TaxID=148448 RepID=A0A1I1GXP3_NATHA|nr:glycosyltransferase family 2 protein [Halobiforma haloterrestris]SFC16285.1 Glycosyltransferase, catalytic subunit of cellulose synthase and poly-beta-1,6-N-acetylglucosamine synthase [Halobiforma haloterrestris]
MNTATLSSPLSITLLVLLGTLFVLYALSALWWLYEVFVLSRNRDRDRDRDAEAFEWGLEDVQVRILTVDGKRVVQGTVDAVPSAIDDVHVIAEAPMDVSGATVHVVPEEFDCEATNKGRALEWASRTLQCEKEYVLYLDEDTIVTDFTGVPDADVVQFTELPIYTGSWFTYCCEVFRVGYQFEQFGFPRLRYPLYAWGGGIAIRRDLEERIGWDVGTVTEDTNFVWRAAREKGFSFRVVDARFRNQAPPTISAMIRQRRRWISGSLQDGGILPLSYRPLYGTRVVVWACSPLVLIWILGVVVDTGTAGLPTRAFGGISAALAVVLVVFMWFGIRAYRLEPYLWPAFLLATPLAVVLHAAGAAWGIVSPVSEFQVTEKIPPETVETVNPALERGDIRAHDGTESLVGEGPQASETGGKVEVEVEVEREDEVEEQEHEQKQKQEQEGDRARPLD